MSTTSVFSGRYVRAMQSGAERARVDQELEELGVASTPETRRLLSLLATEPHTLYGAISRLGELHEPADDELPPVDRLVGEHLARAYPKCTEPSVLHKSKPISMQCKRLLAVLLRDLDTPVPLAELLLANGLRSATPRRLRELETEHGAFHMRTFARDRVQHYVLESAEPDVAACAGYWIRWNLRHSEIAPARRVLALLSSRPGEPTPRADLGYLLPEKRSPGRGRARAASMGAVEEAVDELRGRGYAIEVRGDSFILDLD